MEKHGCWKQGCSSICWKQGFHTKPTGYHCQNLGSITVTSLIIDHCLPLDIHMLFDWGAPACIWGGPPIGAPGICWPIPGTAPGAPGAPNMSANGLPSWSRSSSAFVGWDCRKKKLSNEGQLVFVFMGITRISEVFQTWHFTDTKQEKNGMLPINQWRL